MINTNNAELVLTAGDVSQLIHDKLPQFAFSGRSNVGKSSLLNTLINRKKLARVSSAPGKTITINYYKVDKSLYLVDLPGYGYAKRSAVDVKKWSNLVNGYVSSKDVSCIVQLVDAKAGLTSDDEMMLEWMNANNVSYFIVMTKIDKLNKTDRQKAVEMLKSSEYVSEDTVIVPFSSQTKEGKDEVWKNIFNIL